jgi:type III pantothenate kinase
VCFDLGSCITSELISADGVYHGGSISPGMNMRFKAMHTFTDKLPLVNAGDEKVLLPGDSTEACMRAGVVVGITNEIKGMIASYSEKYPALKVIFTGGDASYFESLLNMNIFVQPNLVLMGLNEILLCHEF